MSTRKLSPNWRTRLPKLPPELKQLENELSAKSGHNCFLPRCTSQGCAHPTFSDRTFPRSMQLLWRNYENEVLFEVLFDDDRSSATRIDCILVWPGCNRRRRPS